MGQADCLRSELLINAGFSHAFFTREGGVSSGPYRSLNFSSGVGDLPDRVQENLRRAAAALKVRVEHLYFLSQVHGNTVVELSGTETRAEVLAHEGDAVTSGSPEIACGVRIADCVPVLLGNLVTGSAGAVHSGWRGTVQNIAERAVHALLGDGDPKSLVAAIGPHISVEAFEVGVDVAETLARCAPGKAIVSHTHGARPHVDLRALIRHQLLEAGLPADQIEDVRGCTFLEPDRFFSYRRDGQRSGRHLAAIVPRPARIRGKSN